MNTEQHPALITERDELPNLALVLPSDLSKDQALTGLVQAIRQVRTDLAARVRLFQQRVRECADAAQRTDASPAASAAGETPPIAAKASAAASRDAASPVRTPRAYVAAAAGQGPSRPAASVSRRRATCLAPRRRASWKAK